MPSILEVLGLYPLVRSFEVDDWPHLAPFLGNKEEG